MNSCAPRRNGMKMRSILQMWKSHKLEKIKWKKREKKTNKNN